MINILLIYGIYIVNLIIEHCIDELVEFVGKIVLYHCR